MPARDDRDREPGPNAQGGRGGRRPLRVQSALDAGRRRRGARPGVRHRGLCDQGRGQRHLLLAHRGCRRPQAAADDGRRRRRDRRPALGPARAARRHHRRHRGDDHRRDPAEGARGRRQARLPDHRRQRGEDQAPLRQPLRDRPVDDRRDHPRDERAARRQALRRRRLRLGRSRRRLSGTRDGRARDRHRGRSDAGARGGDGRLRGAADGARGRDRRHLLHRHRRQGRDHGRAHEADEGRRDPLQHGPLRRRDRQGRPCGRSPPRPGRRASSSRSSRWRTGGGSTSSPRGGSST